MSMFNSDDTQFLAEMRQVYARGEVPPLSDMLRSIELLRGARKRALELNAESTAGKRKSAKPKGPSRSADDLLNELEGL